MILLEELIRKISNIQNKQKTLRWGCNKHSEDECMFAVGSLAYPREVHYFTVTSDCKVNMVDDTHHRVLFHQCDDQKGVIACVIELLKEWFPAKGMSSENN